MADGPILFIGPALINVVVAFTILVFTATLFELLISLSAISYSKNKMFLFISNPNKKLDKRRLGKS